MKPGAFSFAVLNDLHYIEPACGPWLEGLIRKVNALPGLELVLVLGDLAETGSRDELEHAKAILDQLRVPYYVVPGNHDGPEGRPIGSGEAGLAEYLRLFPGRRNYTFTHKGWQFVGLDTTNGFGYQQLPIPGETMEFARRTAATLDRAAPTILFTHMPLDPKIKYASSGGYELLEILAPLNLRIVFSGHYHGLTENRAPGRTELRLLTNRCCSRTRELHDGSRERGFFSCRAEESGEVSYAFVEYNGPGVD